MIASTMMRINPIKDEVVNDDYYVDLSKKDISHFRHLYDKYYVPIFRFVQKRIGDVEVSNDVTSQVFLKAIQSLSKYENRGFPFSSWLYRIATNEVSQHFRSQKVQNQVYIDDKMLTRIGTDMESHDMEGDLVFLEKSIGFLEEEEQSLIQYRFFDDLSYQQISEVTGLSENNARVKTFRIIQKLKKKMEMFGEKVLAC